MASPEDVRRAQRAQPVGIIASIRGRWEQYTMLLDAITTSTKCFLSELWDGVKAGNYAILFRNHDARERSFARWFTAYDHHFKAFEATTAIPGLVAAAHGVVIDLGPGSGNQLSRFDAAAISRIYGVEPNAGFSDALTKRLEELPELREKYTPIFCGIEDKAQLARHGLVPGSVDSIVSVQVICSVAQPEEVARELYELLKPGGQILFYEHCRSNDFITLSVQRLWCLLWTVVVGGCRLDIPVKDILLGAGGWEVAKVEEESASHLMMPRAWGRLVKPLK